MEANAFYTRRKDTNEWLVCSDSNRADYSTVLVKRRNKPPQAVKLDHEVFPAAADIPVSARGKHLYAIDTRLNSAETAQFMGNHDSDDDYDVLDECDGCGRVYQRNELSHHDGTGATLCHDCERMADDTAKVERSIDGSQAIIEQTNGSSDTALVKAIRDAVGATPIDAAEVERIAQGAVQEALEQFEAPRMTIDVTGRKCDVDVSFDSTHEIFPKVLKLLAARVNVFLTGGAGCGKTFMTSQLAEALDVKLYTTGAMLTKYEVTGFIDGHGTYHTTPMREAFEHGGLVNIDEGDSCDPRALVSINALIENDQYSFPDRTVERHPDFVVILCANTIGQGADMVYNGRNPLDGASRDRFALVHMGYDECIEAAIGEAEYTAHGGTDPAVIKRWTQTVQDARRKVAEHKLRHIVSPRATRGGARYLAQSATDQDFADCFEMFILKGADDAVKVKLS